jgi:hypothetical protein
MVFIENQSVQNHVDHAGGHNYISGDNIHQLQEQNMAHADSTEIRQRGRYRFLIVAVIFWSGLLMIPPSAATPPSAMSVSFDNTAHELMVTITHATTNPQIHYIRQVNVRINGSAATDRFYTSQPISDTFTYIYPLQAIPGDTVEVTATCSLTGSSTRTLIVQGDNTATSTGYEPSPPVTQKAAMEFLPVAGLSLVVLARKKI